MLRLLCPVDDETGTVTVIELFLRGVQIESLQSSGSSGGDDTLTESISLDQQAITIRHCKFKVEDGSIVEDSRAFWDCEAKKGEREGRFLVPKLKSLAAKAFEENSKLYDQRDFLKLPKHLIKELNVDFDENQFKLPVRGRRLLITKDEPKKDERPRFKEIYVRPLTIAAIKKTVAQRFKVPLEKIHGVFQFEGSLMTMVELSQDVQLHEVKDGSYLHVAIKD